MLLRFTHYITALIFLTASSVIYENVITPWMQPPLVTAIPLKEDFETRGNPSLVELFPDGSWQRGTCKQLESSNGMLLFASWKQISDDQWKLWPVTIVVGRGMSGETSADPVIIDAPEGAEIIFTESLDVMSGGAPPIHRGRMIGPVHIRRPNSKKENQALSIRTANVGIDNRKIWTTESIEMNVGDARMVGRDLTIHFAGAGNNNPMVLDRMELIYLDELIMPLEKSGPANSPKEENAQFSLQCGGRVEYDFALNQLSLRDSVSLIYQISGSLADYFRCDTLLLKLREPTNGDLRRESPIDWLDKIVATGSPARAVLPTYDSEITANSIEFDSIAGLIQANGKTGVQVKRGGIEATVAQLAYQFDPKRPNMVGAIDVQGAGIVSVDDPEIPILRAHWRDSFKLQPTGLTTTDDLNSNFEVFIDGDIHATLSDGGKFEADNVEGMLKAKSTVDANQKAVTTLIPDWFKAKGDVRIDTSAIAAQTQQLLLFFVDPASEPVAKSVADPPQDANPLRQWVIQPGSGDSTVDPVARPRPVIRGNEISAQLRVDKTGVSAKDLSVTGSVLLTHMLKAGGQMLPAKLTGEELRLIDGGGNDVLQLGSGVDSPARFELGDGFFVGPMIQIWPTENVIRINAAGEFQMPTAALPTSLSGDPDSKIQWQSAPHCSWQGEMMFNGRSAVLTEGVEIKATLLDDGQQWDLLMRGDQLQVDLQQDVQVSDMQTMKNAAIQRVTLSQSSERPVVVRALRRAGDGVLEAKHLLQAAMLTLIPGGSNESDDANSIVSGKLIGQGPGWYRGWMIPPAKSPMSPIAKTKPKPDGRRRLSGVHLIFSDSMQGDLVNKSLEFLRGVRVGVRPVDDWDEVFDAAAMDAISLGDSTIDCDRLQFTVAPAAVGRFNRAPTPWEMEATSGVVFRTRTERGLLEGTASRAAYSSGKDLFTVEGAPNRAAIFRQTLPNGQKGPEGAVKTMTLRPSTMEVQNMQLERLNIATPPTLGNR